ncbi:MAG TPA: universal stress protein [Defluviitaleaceae bacterium]|jgi:K+-sensing histidine kinase KdpD|nr:universal stress protein [Candidatus Epulonipiscium sp.]HOA82132.1 universal stress protein [Defluviitaleaceae bacterium]
MKQKILACITIQQNSRRLIKKGAELAEQLGGELHILHVEQGNSILAKNDTGELLQELFDYASKLGAEVHVVCDDNVPERIASFIKENNITELVIGETMKNKIYRFLTNDIESYITSTTPEVEVVVLEREKALKVKDKEAFSS